MNRVLITMAAMTLMISMANAADAIKEGSSWGGAALGADKVALTKALGSEPNWMTWRDKFIDCLFNDKGQAIEIRFNEGFTGKTSKNIGIGSSEPEILKAYGKPTKIEVKNPETKKLIYDSDGILFWVNKDLVAQIVIFQTPTPKPASVTDQRGSSQQYLSGMIYYQKGDYEKARALWEKALALDPANSDAKDGIKRIDLLMKTNP